MCLLFLSSLSAIALGALDASWSGQRMVSAYARHQYDFMQSEQTLLLKEQEIWQEIRTAGLELWLSSAKNPGDNETNARLTLYSDWLETEFYSPQCGFLFAVDVAPATDSASDLHIGTRWEVCCENRQQCMESGFLRISRFWSRH